jgi:hypothetical protein
MELRAGLVGTGFAIARMNVPEQSADEGPPMHWYISLPALMFLAASLETFRRWRMKPSENGGRALAAAVILLAAAVAMAVVEWVS